MSTQAAESHECWLLLEIREHGDSTVRLLRGAPQPSPIVGEAYRFSPIYSLEPLPDACFEAQPTLYLGFFVHRRPAAGISKLDRNDRKGACHGLGLAAI